MADTPASCSKYPEFESRPGDPLTSPRVFVVFLCLVGEVWDFIFKLVQIVSIHTTQKSSLSITLSLKDDTGYKN
jgi:hypothetical protein